MAKFHNSKAGSPSPDDAPNMKFERADWTSFRTLEGLQQKAGVPANKLIRLVLKELADNALDTGTEVQVGEIDGGYFIDDNGPGLDPNEVASLFSIGRPLSSTKMLRLPTRGALGNGLRVATGAVLASGGKLTVITRGAKLELKPQRDGTTTVTKRQGLETADRNAHRDQLWSGAAARLGKPSIGPRFAVRLAKGGSSYAGASSPYWYDAPSSMSFCRPASAPVCGRWWRGLMAALADARARSSLPLVSAARLAMRSMRPVPLGSCNRLARWPSRSARSDLARSGRELSPAMPTPSLMAKLTSAQAHLRR